MLKRLFPTKQTDDQRHKQALAKMIFLALIALSIVFAHMIISKRKPTSSIIPDSPISEKTLGAETSENIKNQDKALEKNIADRIDLVKQSAEYIGTEIESTTEDVVTAGKKQVEDTTNKLLYSATLKPIVDKIDKLPAAQQEQLRQQICPIVDNR